MTAITSRGCHQAVVPLTAMSVTTGSGFQFPGITTVTYVFVYSPGSMQRDPSPPHHTPPALAGSRGPKRKLYSAVPGRTFIVVKPYTPQGEGEIQLNRGERVKGKFSVIFLGWGVGSFWFSLSSFANVTVSPWSCCCFHSAVFITFLYSSQHAITSLCFWPQTSYVTPQPGSHSVSFELHIMNCHFILYLNVLILLQKRCGGFAFMCLCVLLSPSMLHSRL